MNLIRIKFKDFIKLQRGFDLPRREMKEGPYPVVGSTSVIGYHNDYKVAEPGVVTGRSGSLGEIQYITENYWPHNTALWVKDFKGNLPRYVNYLLKTLDLKRFNSGAGVPTLNRNDLDNLEIAIHNTNDQSKIVAILSTYDDLIVNNLRRIKILEEMAQNLYREWFVKFRFPGHEHARFVDSTLGKIPEGWGVKRVMEFGSVITGKTPSKANPDFYGEDVPFIKTPDMHDNMFILGVGDWLSVAGAQSQANKTIPAGSICVSCIGTIGVVSITTEDCQTNQQINSVVLKNEQVREFLFFHLKGAKHALKNLGASGATMGNVNKGKFESLEMIAPSDNLVYRYHEFAAPLFSEMLVLSRKNTFLRTTLDLLLPKLMSGEVDVSELDIAIADGG